MAALRAWLTGVVAAAILAEAVQTLAPPGLLRRAAAMAGALVLAAAMLRPLGNLRGRWRGVEDYEAEIARRQEELAACQEQALAEAVAERAAALIEDRSAAMGGAVRAVVEVREAEGLPLPWSASLEGPWDEALSGWMAAELGIPPDRQRWTEPGG